MMVGRLLARGSRARVGDPRIAWTSTPPAVLLKRVSRVVPVAFQPVQRFSTRPAPGVGRYGSHLDVELGSLTDVSNALFFEETNG